MCFVAKKEIILFLRVWQTESADLQTFIYLSNQTDEICTNLTRHRGVVTLIGVKVYSWKHESPLFIAESNMNLPDQTTMRYWNRVTYLLK